MRPINHPTHTASILLLCVVTLSMLANCSMQAAVQKRYDSAQDMCHSQAEGAVAQLPNAGVMTTDQRGVELVNQFTICMNQANWKVSNPLKPKGVGPAPVAAAPAPPPVAPSLPPTAPPLAPSTPASAVATAPVAAQPTPPVSAPPVSTNGTNIYYPNAEPTPGRQF